MRHIETDTAVTDAVASRAALAEASAAYAKTVSLCPVCARDCRGVYEERAHGMFLTVDCPSHGAFAEQVESDAAFFKATYARDYPAPVPHLVIPVTYRCNLKCDYCYTLSNGEVVTLPEDRPVSELVEWIAGFDGNVTLIGGEPTVRHDLADILRSAKAVFAGKLSIGSNGQKLANPDYVRDLRSAGLDFVFLSLNDEAYEETRSQYENKLRALENCSALGVPVWLQRTISDLSQLDSLPPLLDSYRRVIFNVTVRAVKPYGSYQPINQIHLSEMLTRLGFDPAQLMGGGTSPFNVRVTLAGRPVKLCSWVNDVGRLDSIDSRYLISDGTLTTFHRGMRMDEVLLLAGKIG